MDKNKEWNEVNPDEMTGASQDDKNMNESGADASALSHDTLSRGNGQNTETPNQEDGVEDENTKESGESKALTAFRNLTAEADNGVTGEKHVSLSSILGGDILGGRWFFRQFWFIVMVVGMLILYVSNRYACQHEMIEGKNLNDTLLDRRYKALTRSSQLKEKTRRSRIEESLVDTTLKTAVTPSFKLVVEE